MQGKTQDYGNTGCGVFKRGYEIRKIVAQESTYSKEIIEFLDLDGELSKIGHHFSNKVIYKFILSKNV